MNKEAKRNDFMRDMSIDTDIRPLGGGGATKVLGHPVVSAGMFKYKALLYRIYDSVQ